MSKPLLFGDQRALSCTDITENPGQLCHQALPSSRGQQTFSEKGQLVNIVSSAAKWSLLQLFNSATVERKQPDHR